MTVRMSEGLWTQLEARAYAGRRSLSATAEMLLERALVGEDPRGGAPVVGAGVEAHPVEPVLSSPASADADGAHAGPAGGSSTSPSATAPGPVARTLDRRR